MTVNYKADMIKHYFNEIDHDYKLDFVLEDKPLGTAGSLSLLKDSLKETFFVTNCDIIIDTDYEEIYRYHKREKNDLTVVAALKHYPIPYGILETKDNGVLTSLSEKPELTFQVNSGMYILEPSLLNEIPENKMFHITHLMEKIMERGGKVGVFPVSEGSWMDIGVWSEYNRTRKIFGQG
jgi:NDP-sugar pyrophosphorylase family protein